MTLDDLVKSNRYPIVFIGSGISKRYLKNSPTWDELLSSDWDNVKGSDSYYQFLDKNRQTGTDDLFEARTLAAFEIEQAFHDGFFKGEEHGLTLSEKDVVMNHLSPYKEYLANKLSKYEIQDDKQAELSSFRKFLANAKMIVTTNYDTFIEDQLRKETKREPTVYVGEEGFFQETDGLSEVYKIHGSVTRPDSLVITSKDYDRYDKNKLLISAKLLVGLIDSPIIFIGYSLTDRNILSLLSDFSKHYPKGQLSELAKKIFVINFNEGQSTIDEQLRTREIGDNLLTYTSVGTDNYTEIYNKISAINEGASPSEIQRYQKLIKRLIKTSGQRGELGTALVNVSSLNELEGQIDSGKPIAVALGNEEYFRVGDLTSYLTDYFNKTGRYSPTEALRFVASNNTSSRVPFARLWKNRTTTIMSALSEKEKSRLDVMISRNGTLAQVKDSVNRSYRTTTHASVNLVDLDLSKHLTQTLEKIVWNIESFDRKDLDDFIKQKILPMVINNLQKAESNNAQSYLRKLLTAYDLLITEGK
jgi:hypothetical protein